MTTTSPNAYQDDNPYAKVNKPKKPPTSEKPAIHTLPPAPAVPVEMDEDDKSYEGETSINVCIECVSFFHAHFYIYH